MQYVEGDETQNRAGVAGEGTEHGKTAERPSPSELSSRLTMYMAFSESVGLKGRMKAIFSYFICLYIIEVLVDE